MNDHNKANDQQVVGIRLRGDNTVELDYDGFLLMLRRLGEYRRIVDAGRALSETLLNLGVCQELWEAQAKMRSVLEASDALTALDQLK